nr:GNAT family N-acetyltransferase [Lentzea sp. NBRC 102530]
MLRPFRTDDLDDFFACRALPEVQRYLYNDVTTRESARRCWPSGSTRPS